MYDSLKRHSQVNLMRISLIQNTKEKKTMKKRYGADVVCNRYNALLSLQRRFPFSLYKPHTHFYFLLLSPLLTLFFLFLYLSQLLHYEINLRARLSQTPVAIRYCSHLHRQTYCEVFSFADRKINSANNDENWRGHTKTQLERQNKDSKRHSIMFKQ